MKNDSQKIIDKIFGSTISVLTAGEKNLLNDIFNKSESIIIVTEDSIVDKPDVLQIILHEGPDLLIFNKNIVYAVEHFEVDSSTRDKKGSSFKQKYNERYYKNREISIQAKLKIKNTIVTTEIIETPFLYNNLLENTKKSINDHYKKVKAYERAIKSIPALANSIIKYIFFIEYQIIFPSFFMNEKNKMVSVFPHNDIAFLNYLTTKNDLLGTIFFYDSQTSQIPCENRFIMIENNNLGEYTVDDKLILDLSCKTINDFDRPMVSSFTTIVPKDIKDQIAANKNG